MHGAYREAQNKFDNFVLGALLAICAYLAQSNPYAPLGLNHETIFLLSLLSFILSSLFGFKRIEDVITGYRFNHILLDAGERNDINRKNEAKEKLNIIKASAESNYKLRNKLMFCGLILYVIAKYAKVYA